MGKGGGGGGGGGGSTPILSEIASIYSSTEQAKAAHKALDAQKKALELQRSIWNREIDPDKFDRLAVEYDTRQIERRQEFLKTYEPELYELRQLSKQQLLDSAKETKSQSESHQLATKLFSEIKDEDPRIKALKDSLIANAQTDLESGATLPPEFQQELVRAGLNKGSQAGIGFGKNAIGGGVARLLGTAGEQLRQSRNQEATNLVNAAQNLTTARTNILASVFPQLRNLELADRAEAIQNFSLTNTEAPTSGISGADAINTQLMKLQGRLGFIQRYANIKGARGQVDADKNSAIAGASANLIGDIVKLVAGGGVGGIAGGLGGIAGGASEAAGSLGGIGGGAGAAGAATGFSVPYLQTTGGNGSGASSMLNFLKSYGG